jgi:hypothetical protein
LGGSPGSIPQTEIEVRTSGSALLLFFLSGSELCRI